MTGSSKARNCKYPVGMHFSFVGKFAFIVMALLPAPFLSAQTPAVAPAPAEAFAAARQLLQQGDFQGAAAAFQKMIESRPSPELYAGLVQSLLKLDDVKAADESSRKVVDTFPQSALAHATRGDAYFRRGMIPEAESEYDSALKLDQTCARAWLGRGKVDAVLARRSQAREAVNKAHELDPGDGDALYEWAIRRPYPENVAALERHLAEFRSDPQLESHERDYKELMKALAGRPVWILSPDVPRAELKLEPMIAGPGQGSRGFGLRVTFNDRAEATLLMDTGASGVTITRKFAEKIGARKLSDTSLEGVGKSGAAHGYHAWVDTIAIGGLKFHECFVHVTPGSVADLDGMIGTDVFVNFLVTVDFPKRKLRLDPLPEPSSGPEPSPSNDARASAADFSQAFGFGHFLLLWTQAGDKVAGLFVVDSGSNLSSIAPEPARQLAQMRPLNATVTGMSGGVNSAFFADDLTLQFGKVRRKNQRIITVDLHSVSKNLGTEVSGQIGFNTLEDMRVVINYRDGLVGFGAK
ncbi:MAG TPA: aspartyl protease family protein [Candidatus Angelobacter sp.]